MTARTALLIEDDVLTHWLIEEALTHAGYDVVSACRGAEAICLLDRHVEFDLLVCDLALPDVCGTDLGHFWRRAAPGKPVIYTGAACQTMIPRLEPHETFLAKPFTLDRLLQAVEDACDDAIYRPVAFGTADGSCYLN